MSESADRLPSSSGSWMKRCFMTVCRIWLWPEETARTHGKLDQPRRIHQGPHDRKVSAETWKLRLKGECLLTGAFFTALDDA